MIDQLVVNGCSYMEAYAMGEGHWHLADLLGISDKRSLAIGGSANSRIIRTTLKHSYQATRPTFYVLGMTFLSRNEIPILQCVDAFEGMWTNPQNQQMSCLWQPQWTQRDTDLYVDLKLKTEIHSIEDRLEDLMYRIVSMGTDLICRGHRLVVFQQADNIYLESLDHPRFDLFRNKPWIVDGYRWRATPWQHDQGVPAIDYGSSSHAPPIQIRHRAPGQHQVLNQYLAEYVSRHQLLR